MTYHDYISDATLQYLLQQYPEHTPGWLKSFQSEVHRLEDLWGVEVEGYERESRFGTILYGQSERFGSVAMKIVPWFSPRLKGEVYCYRHLPYREMCPLYAVDDHLGAMLLKYVPPTATTDSAKKEAVLAALYAQRREADAQDHALPCYNAVLEEVTGHALEVIGRTGDRGYAHLSQSIAMAREAMQAFSGSPRYMIHGDAHAFNLLEEGDSCLLIDPLGYRAPFAFEWARYLGSAMKETALPEADFRALALRLTQENAPLEEALRAVAIDTTLRACNTFVEGNTHAEICFAADWAKRAWDYYTALRHT